MHSSDIPQTPAPIQDSEVMRRLLMGGFFAKRVLLIPGLSRLAPEDRARRMVMVFFEKVHRIIELGMQRIKPRVWCDGDGEVLAPDPIVLLDAISRGHRMLYAIGYGDGDTASGYEFDCSVLFNALALDLANAAVTRRVFDEVVDEVRRKREEDAKKLPASQRPHR